MSVSVTKLVTMVEKHADELAAAWLKDVNRRGNMVSFHKHDQKLLSESAIAIFGQLGQWIECNYCNKEEIARYFQVYGAQRRQEGFALPEILHGLILSKRHIWLKVLSDGLLDNALDLLQALELNNQVVLFFDRASYNTVIGFERGE